MLSKATQYPVFLILSFSCGNEQTDLHLHSEECDKLLNGTDWQPEIIVQKLPEFIQFVQEIQDFVVREMKGNGSTRTGEETHPLCTLLLSLPHFLMPTSDKFNQFIRS